ncbi:MAG TPA: Panacea domain-containing protein [Tepidisphaeraceae bacterium]|jgi:uncharacterized phage-associated protein
MLIPIVPLKIAQAAAVLLKTETAWRMSRLRLLKLLYIADREALTERARPITGDKPVAMDHGPVLSQTYDLIKGTDYASPQWERFMKTEGREVTLVEDPGVGKLTRYEITKLQEVASRYKECDDWAVADLTHSFPEWIKNQPAKGTSKPIPLDDLLDATGHAQDKDHLIETERAETAFQRLISSVEK